MSTDLPVVYFAANMEEADLVVSWLRERGIRADVKDRYAANTMEVRTIPSPSGIEVCVFEPKQAEPARSMLLEQFTARYEERADRSQLPPADAACEECGETSTYPPEVRGRVESCPQCGAYVDVPA